MSDVDQELEQLKNALRRNALTAPQRAGLERRLAPLLEPGGGGGVRGPSAKTIWIGVGALGSIAVLLGSLLWTSTHDVRSNRVAPAIPADEGEALEPPEIVETGLSTHVEGPTPIAPEVVAPEAIAPEANAPAAIVGTEERNPQRRSPSLARVDPRAEHALLREARATLEATPARALELTEQHRVGFPRGVLTQEREMIAIEALERLGRTRAASRRAASFVSQWPTSPYVLRLRELGLLEGR
jgi:hypothetical protein